MKNHSGKYTDVLSDYSTLVDFYKREIVILGDLNINLLKPLPAGCKQ